MKSFKEIAEYLQEKAGTRNGISAIDVRIVAAELMLDLWGILNEKGEHKANMLLFEAFNELRDQKSKEDEKSN